MPIEGKTLSTPTRNARNVNSGGADLYRDRQFRICMRDANDIVCLYSNI